MVRKVLRGTQNVKRRPTLATSLTCGGCRLDAMTRMSYPAWFRANIGDRLSLGNHLAMRTNRPLSVYAVGSWHGASCRDGMINATFAVFLLALSACLVALVAGSAFAAAAAFGALFAILAAIPVVIVGCDVFRAITGADEADAVMVAARFQASRAGKKLPR